MIIRLTLGDNDFTSDLEDFCKRLRDRMFAFDEPCPDNNDYPGVEEYSQAIIDWLNRRKLADETRRYLMNPDNRFSKKNKEYHQICQEVKRLWIKFAKEIDMERFVPDISIQYSLDEKWENGEVVYYFTPYDRFITQ